MTVSTTTARNVKTGNGVTTSFPFDFAFEVAGDLVVTLVVTATGVETLQTLTTDYTTTGGSGATGTIEMIVAPATGEELVIERDLAYTQGVDYQPNDPFPAEVNETALDRLTFLVQQILDFTQRSLKLKKTTTLTDVTFPDPEVDKVLVGKNATEFENKTVLDLAATTVTLPLPIVDGGTGSGTASAARAALGPYADALVTVTGSTTARSLTSRFGEVYNVLDYGAVGDDVANDTAAVQAAIDAAEAARGGVVFFPPGNYLISGQLTIDGHSITLRGSGTGGTSVGATRLHLTHTAASQILIGNATTQRQGIAFENFQIEAAAGTQYTFETQTIRGLRFRDITFDGVYGFLSAGRSGDETSFVWLDRVEGNMNTTTHDHFLKLVNLNGALWISNCHIEGAPTPTVGSTGIHIAAASTRPDGVQITNSTFGLFDKGYLIDGGSANFYSTGVILDRMQAIGIDVDTSSGICSSFSFIGGSIKGLTAATDQSRGILLTQNTNALEHFTIAGVTIADFGRDGILTAGAPNTIKLIGNNIESVGQNTDDTYDGISVVAGATSVSVIGNTVSSTKANKHRYGVLLGTVDPDSIMESNASTGHQTEATTRSNVSVTQITSLTTGVTINTPAGTVTSHNVGTIAAAAEADVVVTNSVVRANDTPVVSFQSAGDDGSLSVSVVAIANGSFTYRLTNLHASTSFDAATSVYILHFKILKVG